MTNREYLNGLSDKELAEFWDEPCKFDDKESIIGYENCNDTSCSNCFLYWLQAEYKEPEPVLKPCPFCGGEALLTTMKTESNNDYLVMCRECSMKTPLCFTKPKAIEVWNKRV